MKNREIKSPIKNLPVRMPGQSIREQIDDLLCVAFPLLVRQAMSAKPITADEELTFQQLRQLHYWHEKQRSSLTVDNPVPSAGSLELPEEWLLTRNITLSGWQNACVEAWFGAGRRGVIKVVTGAGKTVVAERQADALGPK